MRQTGTRGVVGLLLATLAMLATSSLCEAQVSNPRRVEFTVSVDHNVTDFDTPRLTRYELRIFAAGNPAAPITTADLGKPAAADGATVGFDRPEVFALVPAVGDYTAVVVAIGPAGEGAAAPVPFVAAARLPAPATAVTLRP